MNAAVYIAYKHSYNITAQLKYNIFTSDNAEISQNPVMILSSFNTDLMSLADCKNLGLELWNILYKTHSSAHC